MIRQHLARYQRNLDELESRQCKRFLSKQEGIDFSSNDYLALAGSERLISSGITALKSNIPVGSGASRLLRGNHPEHEALEAEAAAFFGSERMLYFGSGYVANMAVLSTLPQSEDLVVYDALVHASAHMGMAVGRAQPVSVPHNDVDAFADAISRWRKDGGTGCPWIVVESLYSMDGDRAPLHVLSDVADRYGAFLYIDEAHATGVHGPQGRGLAANLEPRDNILTLHTCGKALGSAGALVGANRLLCDFLVNRAKPFIYSTAPAPSQAAYVREALRILQDEPERRTKLHDLTVLADTLLQERFGTASGSQIQPVIIGENDRTLRIAGRLQEEGFDIRAIRPPTVPIGTSRLRIAITLNVDAPTIIRMIGRLGEIVENTV